MWGTDSQIKDFAKLYPYFHGDREERNPSKGIKALRALADSGYVPALFQVGLCYYDGLGVKRSYEESFRLYLQAAEKGYPSAQCGVGNYYAIANPKYEVCELDPRKAASWWLKAANNGNSGAQCNLAGYHLNGSEKESDPIEAYIWGSLAVDCSTIRFRAAEVYRDRAREMLDDHQVKDADRRIHDLKVKLPHPWSDHMTYWRGLYQSFH